MDKYEFNIKVEQIKKMVSRGDYETAMKIADTIDWKKTRNTRRQRIFCCWPLSGPPLASACFTS